MDGRAAGGGSGRGDTDGGRGAGDSGLAEGSVGIDGAADSGGSNSASIRDTATSRAFSSRAMSLSGNAGFSDRN
jgi:hypothetical protein